MSDAVKFLKEILSVFVKCPGAVLLSMGLGSVYLFGNDLEGFFCLIFAVFLAKNRYSAGAYIEKTMSKQSVVSTVKAGLIIPISFVLLDVAIRVVLSSVGESPSIVLAMQYGNSYEPLTGMIKYTLEIMIAMGYARVLDGNMATKNPIFALGMIFRTGIGHFFERREPSFVLGVSLFVALSLASSSAMGVATPSSLVGSMALAAIFKGIAMLVLAVYICLFIFKLEPPTKTAKVGVPCMQM